MTTNPAKFLALPTPASSANRHILATSSPSTGPDRPPTPARTGQKPVRGNRQLRDRTPRAVRIVLGTGRSVAQATMYGVLMDSDNAEKLAVLIDADNTPPTSVEGLLAEIAQYGTAHAKRAYGDWTGTSLNGWKAALLTQSIQPIQQFAYTTGKNATDAAMIIDAMDLLYSWRFDGFCLVSSDSDFTRLASRIRESGLTVYGFGAAKTPPPFVAACDKFIYLENLTYADVSKEARGTIQQAGPALSTAELKGDTALVNALRGAIEAASDEDAWADLALVGNLIRKRRPDFDTRSYGYAKLSDLIEASALFDLHRRYTGNGKPAVVHARDNRVQRYAASTLTQPGQAKDTRGVPSPDGPASRTVTGSSDTT